MTRLLRIGQRQSMTTTQLCGVYSDGRDIDIVAAATVVDTAAVSAAAAAAAAAAVSCT
jgi:hypothetical protein